MRQLRQVRNAIAIATPSGLGRTAYFLLILVPLLLAAASAFAEPGGTGAGNFNQYAQKSTNNTVVIIDIINYIAFLCGCVLVGLGISELRRLADGSGGGGLAARQPLAKLGFGGMLLAVPYFTSVFQGTMGGDGSIFDMFIMNAYEFQGKASAVSSSSLGGLIKNGINNVMVLVDVANVAAFIIGVFFVVRGIQLLRGHIDNPGNVPVAEPLKRLAVGGALLSFPVIVNVVYKTFGAAGSAMSNSGWSSAAGTGGGAGGVTLDSMMTNLIQDISNPAYVAIELFCYIAGIVMVLFALQRLVRTAQDGPRGPLGLGTITMFIVAGCLLSFPQFLAVLDFSLLGGGVARTNVTMSVSGVDAAQLQTAKNIFSAVLAFMAVIGFLSVVRGLFMLKSLGDGNQQVSMMAVATHLVAGSLAINLGSFINAVQNSLGVSGSPVTFN